MAEKVKCTVGCCDTVYEPGHGGTGGPNGRCPRHYALKRRNSPNADVGEVLLGDGSKDSRITIHCSPRLVSWTYRQAKQAGKSASGWVEELLSGLMAVDKRAK